jgi:L-glyceraldehyde reductase
LTLLTEQITSKLWNTHHEPEHVEEAVDQSLRDLQVAYLDLYLIHWPVAFRYSTTTIQPVDAETGLVDVIDVPIKDTWAAMEKLVDKGKVRSIGVSNFTRKRIEELMTTYVSSSSLSG